MDIEIGIEWELDNHENICLFNFIRGSLRDNDNCRWQLERGGESDHSQSGETREGDTVVGRPRLLCFK